MFINLTQHKSTAEQIKAGVQDLIEADYNMLISLLTFDELPSSDDIEATASMIAVIASEAGAKKAMIGGAPYLMTSLEKELWYMGITPVYAFSQRRSEEQTMPDGSVSKKTIFVHQGFVEAPRPSNVDHYLDYL